MPVSRPGRQRGLTLPELLVACAVLGVLAALVLPRLGGAVAAGHAADARAALLRTYASGNRAAVVRGQHVVACPGSAATGCLDGFDWSGGWILFADRDADRRLDGDERVLEAVPPLAGGVGLFSTRGRRQVVFQPQGGNAGANATFTLCDDRGESHATQLVLANDGRLRARPAPTDAARHCLQATP